MKNTKQIAVFILTAIVFLSSVFLGVSAVYRVEVVHLQPLTISEESTSEVEEIYTRLVDAYEKQSYFFVDKEKAKEILSEFPYFRLLSFEKSYPNKITVKIQEDEEVYAVKTSGEDSLYYVLGEDGTILGIRDTYANRLDGENNILIKGMTLQGVKGEQLSGNDIYPALMEFCKTASRLLEGIRRNVVEIELLGYAESIVRITMREGVKIYVGDIDEMPKEKAIGGIEKYLSLNDENKLTGRISVTAKDGRLNVNYEQKDLFE